MTEERLKPDGERFLPEFSGTIELEHYHRYLVARDVIGGMDVLDIACGEGFGSDILARKASSVVGVDIAPEAVAHASRTYRTASLRFETGNATAIPLEASSVDAVVSFETIEHLAEHDEMIDEIRRVLRPGGLLIMSSPNKQIYTDKRDYHNKFHVRELYTDEFVALLQRHFKNVSRYGQRVTASSLIIPDKPLHCTFRTYYRDGATDGLPDPMYDILLASDEAVPALPASAFEDKNSPLQPQAAEILLLENRSLRGEIKATKVERDAAIENAEAMTVERDTAIAERQELKKDFEIRVERLEFALKKLAADANIILADKWWRRTQKLRLVSNKIRQLKGKQPRNWKDKFVAAEYKEGTLPENSLLASSMGGDHHPDIPTVGFSSVDEGFVSYRPLTEPIETSPRLIAFYLPQFHPFPENDRWWGKGFTEWTNVGKATPKFDGHHQPHCPIHLGYYDLRIPEVMEEQAALARSYGISGFAYYFYWFAGKVLMEQPLRQMLDNPAINMPFFFIWANENWTRRWDGQEDDVLIAQDHSAEDSRAFLNHIKDYFEDPRYIRVDGKPVLVIYRADILPEMKKTLDLWREQAVEMGFRGLYVMCAQTFGHRDPRRFGFDAAMDFPPHTVASSNISERLSRVDTDFSGNIFDYDQAVTSAVVRQQEPYKLLPTAMLSWDNTARKGLRSNIFANFSVTRYAQWLSANAERVAKDDRLSPGEKMIFVNAWNEWAEGTHLEPDQKHGFGYLEATRAVISNYASDANIFTNPEYPKERSSEAAIIVHFHFENTWPDLREGILRLARHEPDVYVSTTSLALAQLAKRDFPDATVEIFDNRGRDIRPFLIIFRNIATLGYTAVCKVHGKASSYRSDGEALRRTALDVLMTEKSLAKMCAPNGPGMLVPKTSLIPHSEKNLTYSGSLTASLAKELGLSSWKGNFPAGSMFWFRPGALAPLTQVDIEAFDIERGLADGTRAHAVERLFCAVCKKQKYEVATTEHR